MESFKSIEHHHQVFVRQKELANLTNNNEFVVAKKKIGQKRAFLKE